MSALILDGHSLARRRCPIIAARAAAVRSRRGHAPSLVIVAFGDQYGRVSHLDRKLRMCATVGVDVTPVTIPPETRTADAVRTLKSALDDGTFDGVFVQVPFPVAIDGDAFTAAIPVERDVDIMTPVRIARFMNGIDPLPPVTVAAALLLLDDYRVAVTGMRGVVIADENPFSVMFRAALVLHGAQMDAIVPPGAPDLNERVHAAELVVVAAESPGLVPSTLLSKGAVAIDAGYFNEGGRGDIDPAGGTAHLAAIAPVPGGIGPMTVSTLAERVVLFAEGG